MDLFKKNRIWKKMSAWGMVFLMSGMVLCGGSAQTMVYAADTVYEETYDSTYVGEELQVETETREEAGDEVTAAIQVEDTGLEDASADGGEQEYSDDSAADMDDGNESEKNESNENNKSENDENKDDVDENGEDKQKKQDFTLTVQSDEDRIKAGRDLVYTVILENTGDVMLKNIRLDSQFSQESLHGEWSKDLPTQLDAGMKEELYLTVKLPEEQTENVFLQLRASAEPELDEGTESTTIMRKASLDTEIIPLKVSFEVTKTADRSVAVPGDQIMFQICIRNTGERTLHSVITTERFQTGKIPVQFLEKEGVVLNKAKTKARIDQIEPGKAAGLQAMVTLPEDVEAQELLNEVIVTTLETGEQAVTSQAKVQIKAAEKQKEENEEAVEKESIDMDGGAVPHAGESYPASTHPKTGDPYQPLLWLAMIPGSLLAAGWIRSRM